MMALLGSSRRNGNTEYLVNEVLEGVDHKEVYLLDHHMNPIIDERHTEQGFGYINDDYEELFFEFMKHDTIIFATPSYWFGMSAQMKIFFDRWSQYMRDDRIDFKEEMRKKQAYVIVIGNKPDPKIAALPLIQQFHYIFDYVGMEFKDYIIGQANKPQEILNDSHALTKAAFWNNQFKQSSHR
ncbi:flavodoxin family protein [Oceanobacillus limi]|uniref:flavodoxin family protein n=1 Tax=Oceanobacillus limi TaxID=930131 RepID=UPI00147AFE06|nr:flavodoxin family protein [Oceanobacillus limi]